jgi:hypothetical protein
VISLTPVSSRSAELIFMSRAFGPRPVEPPVHLQVRQNQSPVGRCAMQELAARYQSDPEVAAATGQLLNYRC